MYPLYLDPKKFEEVSPGRNGLEKWLKKYGERITPPRRFFRGDVLVMQHCSFSGADLSWYVVTTESFYLTCLDQPGIKKWYRVPRALLLPFTDVPLF